MITDTQFAAWLKNPAAIRCVLVEADVKPAMGGGVVTRYLSNRGYNTGPMDTPSSTNYAARVSGGIKFSRSLSLDGTPSLSFGDIELINTDGALDDWLDDYWINRKIVVLVGDISWARADFRTLYVGTLTGVDARKRDRINLKLSDALQRLNSPVTESKVGSGLRADDLRPLCFGECHNISPVLVDSTVNEYMVHDGAIEGIIEVRDNGVPVAFTPVAGTGKFRLNQQPAGTVTASVQGALIRAVDSSSVIYRNDIPNIIFSLMTEYGTAATRLSSIDIDTASMVQFTTDHPVAVGIYLDGRKNVLEVCNQLAASVGARLYVTRSGLISLVQLSLPWYGSTVASVTSADMVDHTLEPKQMVGVTASKKVGYCKNWTVQDGLTTGLIQEHIALFAEEWLSVTATDSTAASNYNLYTDPALEETLLLEASPALTEANRRLGIYSVQRKVFKFTGLPSLFGVNLGEYVNLSHPRFGLNYGKVGQVVSVGIDPMSPLIEFEVLL